MYAGRDFMNNKISITTLFDAFFKYQLDMEDIAAWFREKKLDSFKKVLIYLIAYFDRDYIMYREGQIKANNPLLFEFEKALAYHICKINGII